MAKCNTLKGKVTNSGSMYVQADVKNTGSKKPIVDKGGDLRSKK